MSLTDTHQPGEQGTGDPWADLAEHRETLEMVADEDVPFAKRARRLLRRLDEEGY